MRKALTDSFLNQLELMIKNDPLRNQWGDTEAIVHDLRASTTAMAIMIESMEAQAGSPPNEREQRKLEQLKAHARINQKTIEAVIKAITNSYEKKA